MATIDAHYFNVCVRGAERRGYDSKGFFARAGIDTNRLVEIGARESVEKMAALVRDIWITLDDEFMGYTELRTKSGSFAVMSEYSFHSASVLEALRKGVQFYAVLTDEIVTNIETDRDSLTLTCHFRQPELDPDHYFMEFWLIIWHRLACWFAGETLPIRAAGFSYDRPQHYYEEFRRLFPCEHMFNEARCSLRFSIADLLVPVRRSLAELRQMLTNAPLDLMTIPASDNSVSRRVREVLRPWEQGIYAAKSANEVAAELGMSPVVMRRRLRSEGSSFRKVCEAVRRDLACAKLRDTGDSIENIAADLGYLETRSFTRAFRSWTGSSPIEYRMQKFLY